MMAIKKFDFNNGEQDEYINYFQEETQQEEEELTVEDKRCIEKEYKRLVTASTEKLYLGGALLSLIVLRLIAAPIVLVICVPALFVMGYYLTMKHNKRKLEEYEQQLGYTPEVEVSKLSKLYNKFTKGV